MRVADIMSRKVVSISADDTLRIVREIMNLGGTRHLPVVRRGEVVGVVSQRDLLHASLSNVIGIDAQDHDAFLEGVSISEVMTSPAICVSSGAAVQAAAGTMAGRKIGCLPVVDEGKLVGIVTETDVLHYFAAQDVSATPKSAS